MIKYSREVNRSGSVEEVGTYALEAMFHVMEGHSTPTVLEVRGDDLRVVGSLAPEIEGDGDPPAVERRAHESGATVVLAGEDVAVDYQPDDAVVARGDDEDASAPGGAVIATPGVSTSGVEDVGVVLSVRWTALDAVEEHHVLPLEHVADHVATAVDNIRSRQRLQRARDDLATRKEMVEMYDRLLRPDLGNDLQVIAGYAETLTSAVPEDAEAAE